MIPLDALALASLTFVAYQAFWMSQGRSTRASKWIAFVHASFSGAVAAWYFVPQAMEILEGPVSTLRAPAPVFSACTVGYLAHDLVVLITFWLRRRAETDTPLLVLHHLVVGGAILTTLALGTGGPLLNAFMTNELSTPWLHTGELWGLDGVDALCAQALFAAEFFLLRVVLAPILTGRLVVLVPHLGLSDEAQVLVVFIAFLYLGINAIWLTRIVHAVVDKLTHQIRGAA